MISSDQGYMFMETDRESQGCTIYSFGSIIDD